MEIEQTRWQKKKTQFVTASEHSMLQIDIVTSGGYVIVSAICSAKDLADWLQKKKGEKAWGETL